MLFKVQIKSTEMFPNCSWRKNKNRFCTKKYSGCDTLSMRTLELISAAQFILVQKLILGGNIDKDNKNLFFHLKYVKKQG